MLIRKTFKFRLKPRPKELDLLLQFAGARRWVYNRGLAQRKEAFEKRKERITLFDQNNELVLLKTQEETLWLQDIHSQVLQQALHDLDSAYDHFFRRLKNREKPGYPRFKCRGEQDSFRYPQGVKVRDGRAWLPKIGWMRFKKTREIEGEIKQTTVIREGDRWYVCFSCEIEQEITPREAHDLLGIDLGIEFFAVGISQEDEVKVASPSFLKAGLSHLRFLNRQLSKKVKGSKNRLKAKAELNLCHAQIRNQRKNFLHELSTLLVKSHDAIVVENLKIKSLLMKTTRGMARAISDAGWREFLEMLAYKCLWYGKKLIEVGEYFASTKLCSLCGAKNEMPLSMRTYRCSCGLEIHRDINAARNIRAAGMSVLKPVELPH